MKSTDKLESDDDERKHLADMIRRNLKTGLMEGNLCRVLEYLERT